MYRNNRLRHGGAFLFFSAMIVVAALVALVADVVDVLH